MRRWLALALLLGGCAKAPEGEVYVAAAANLARVFPDLSAACAKRTGVRLTPSFGSTAQLAQQIENGGPFDLFLAADTEHVDELASKGLIAEASRAIYARGTLVMWAPKRPDLAKPEDLARPDVKKIGIARPELAPYGRASIETLTAVHLWPQLEGKAVYAQNISAVKQFADSSNVDAAFTALALVIDSGGHYATIDEKLHRPIEQAMCVLKNGAHADRAKQCAAFLASDEAKAIFRRAGYGE